jgi:hypothetical protein
MICQKDDLYRLGRIISPNPSATERAEAEEAITSSLTG